MSKPYCSARTSALACLLGSTTLLAACGGGGTGADASATDATQQTAPQDPAAGPAEAASVPGSPFASEATAGAARVYYIDSQLGNDSYDGAAPAHGTASVGPWRTLAKLAATALIPGDVVRLLCGKAWNETLRISASGTATTPITVGAYPAGCANGPVIDGSTTIAPASWALYQGSIYRAPLTGAPQILSTGAGQLAIAHHPNRGFDSTQPTSLYLRNAVASDSTVIGGVARSTYVTTGPDLGLPAGASLTAGTPIRIRTNAWVIDETTIATVAGSRLTLATPTSYVLAAGWGYYLLGKLWMLDSPGEWVHDAAAGYVYAWMPDSLKPSVPVYAANLVTGIDLQARNYVQVDGLTVRYVTTGVNMRGTIGSGVRNARIEDTTGVGIDAAATVSATLTANTFTRTGSDAIAGNAGNSYAATGLRATSNTISAAGVIMNGDTVVSLPRQSSAAILSGVQSVVTGNSIRDAAYSGIWPMAGSTINDNYIRGACSVLDDCGGIYTLGGNNNSVISNNIVEHARGAFEGKTQAYLPTQAYGIYLDESASGVTVSGNTVADADSGILIHVANNNRVENNKLYGNRSSQIFLSETRNSIRSTGDVFANVITGNHLVATVPAARAVVQQTRISTTAGFGQYDANRYYDRLNSRFAYESTPTGQQEFTFSQWQTASSSDGAQRNLDPNGHAASEQHYAPSTVTGANIVPNGSLLVGTTGWAIWNQTAPYSTLFRETCAPGICARYIAGASQSHLTTPYFSVRKDQWYRISMDLMAPTDNQKVEIILRRSGGGTNGFESLSKSSLGVTAGRVWKRYSVAFQGLKNVSANDPVTLDYGARVDIQLEPGQTVSVANVEILATTPPDASTSIDLLLNTSSAAIQLACPVATTNPARCGQYVKFSDDSVVTWPYSLPARSSEIVYSRDGTLIDTDGDGVADYQDACPGTTAGAGVNSRGCGL